MDRHNEILAGISRRVRFFREREEPFRIFHGGSNSTRQPRYSRQTVEDTSLLNNVLKIDLSSRTVLTEPNVSMIQLVGATLKEGLIPPVIMEFPAITVGGAFAGTAGESSSFKYGLFDSTVEWIEIVLADGAVMTASCDENADLLRGAAGTCGTLGVVTLLRVRLIPAAQFVELTYHPVECAASALRMLEKGFSYPEAQYIDGVMFNKDSGVVMIGVLQEAVSENVPVQRFRRARDPWFFDHARRSCLKSSSPFKVAIPIKDYFFRWDRGAFWGGIYAFRYFVTPFNRVSRYLLDPFMHAETMFHALHESGIGGETFIQDMGVSLEKTEDFLQFLHHSISLYPLWLCPVRHDDSSTSSFQLSQSKADSGMIINVGIWGPGPKDSEAFRFLNRQIEHKCHELGGYKCLYARSYYTKEEFWNIYDEEKYFSLRTKYRATTLPTVYDKIRDVDSDFEKSNRSWRDWLYVYFWTIWPLSGLYGVFCVLRGSEFLLKG